MAVEFRIDRALELAIAAGRDVGAPALGCDQVEQGLGVVAAIGDEVAPGREAGEESRSHGLVGGLAWREDDPDRQAAAVDDDVELGAQSSTRTTDGVIRPPFFPPAACWWARMIELSIKAMEPGDLAAKVSNTRTQTPARAHRLKRL